MPSRRDMLALIAAALAHPGLARAAGAAPFSWDGLKAEARALAGRPHVPTPPARGADAIDYDAVNRISFDPAGEIWPGRDHPFAVRLFPVGKHAPQPVEVHVVEGGIARPVSFRPALFDVRPGKGGPVRLVPGFAGLRFMNPGGVGDWLAFLGASYFRSAGPLAQYGLSARGLAIDTGIDGAEEFPRFTRFWLERTGADAVTLYALLDGQSVSGAYRFVNRRRADEVVQEVSVALYLRRDIARLGIAPLTSMFWYGEGNRAQAIDWRPEIHDSDGLQLLTGAGEHLWRPLRNPPRPTISSFADAGPRGFGLMQRDRTFDNYQDDGVFYEKRPGLWVEPQGDWGAGAVMLYEIPTAREYEDNIVAFWTPAAPSRAGDAPEFAYRLRWLGGDPAPTGLARVRDCWTGTAGPAAAEPIPGARRIVADFEGAAVARLGQDDGVTAAIRVTRGRVIESRAYPVQHVPGRWRFYADIALDGGEAADLSARLTAGGAALSETLVYQLG
jgi:glucans biosynthesis protein